MPTEAKNGSTLQVETEKKQSYKQKITIVIIQWVVHNSISNYLKTILFCVIAKPLWDSRSHIFLQYTFSNLGKIDACILRYDVICCKVFGNTGTFLNRVIAHDSNVQKYNSD